MSTTTGSDDTLIEHCESCDRRTPHDVEVRIVQEGVGPYSNEPYRAAECQRCGESTVERMNNA